MALFRRTLLPLLISLWLVASGVAATFRGPLPCASRGCEMACCQPKPEPTPTCCASQAVSAEPTCCAAEKPDCGSCGCISEPAPEPPKATVTLAFEQPTIPVLWVQEEPVQIPAPPRPEIDSPAPSDARGPPGSPGVALPLLRAPPVA